MNIQDNNNGGNFSVSRSIWTSDLFAKEPFTEREAWIWMISSAVWRDKTTRVGHYIIELERGQLCYSIRFLAKAWGWSKSKVDRYLKRLETMDATRSKIGTPIGTASGTPPMVITICNYNEYQPDTEKAGHIAGQSAGQKRDTSGTNKNKDNKDNKIRDTKVSLDHPEIFDRFWSLYPRKVGKGQAQAAWKAAAKKVDPQLIIEGLQIHMPDLTDKPPQFIPHASTWLNGERWADELEQHGDPFWDTFTWENAK